MVQRVLLISVFIIGTLLSGWGPPPAQAAAPEALALSVPVFSVPSLDRLDLEKTTTLADLGYLRDETLQGVSATRTYALNWPDAWEVQPGNTFTVEYVHSPSLKSYSSLAIDWNGTRLGSVLLTPESADGGSLTVALPEGQIETGYNALRIVLYMGIEDDFCEDPNNPATWATIKSSSFFSLSYAEKAASAVFDDYPVPFIDNSSLLENDVTFVLPQDPTAAELNSLALISAKLGQLAAWRVVNINTLMEPDAGSEALTGDVIYIGQADRLEKLRSEDLPFTADVGGKVALTSGSGVVVDPKAGVLYMQPSAGDPATVEMFVTGADDAAVLTAARALATQSAFSRLQGSQGVVLSVPEPDSSADSFRQRLSFAELGYEDQTAAGTRAQTLNYVIPLQMQWQVLTEATLELHFAHSPLLDNEQSSLTVAVNGTPVGSILLDQGNVDDGHATFTIPARLLMIGDNKITITTDIELIDGYEDDEECDDEHIAEAWVVVYSDSNFTLPGGPAATVLNLRDYPYAFIGRVDLADLAFILPDQPSPEVVAGLAAISAQIGRSAEGDGLFPHVVFAGNAQAADQYRYQILIGLPDENAAIAALNDRLPLPFESGNMPRSLPQVAQIAPANGSAGYVQAVLTENDEPRLIVSGSGNEGLTWAAAAVSQPALMRDLNGDLAILDSGNSITTASIHQPAAPVDVTPAETATQSPATRWVVWLAAGLFLVAIVVLLMIAGSDLINRRKARKSYESSTL